MYKVANLNIKVRASSGQNMGFIAPVVWELWPVEIEKKGDFLRFLYFAYDCSNLRDIFANYEVSNLKIYVRANSGQKMGFVAPVVWELWSIEILKKLIFFIFSILHDIVQT